MQAITSKWIFIYGACAAVFLGALWSLSPARGNSPSDQTPPLKITTLDPNTLKETTAADWVSAKHIEPDDVVGLWEYHGVTNKPFLTSSSYHTFQGVTYAFNGSDLDIWANRDVLLNLRPDHSVDYQYVRQEFHKKKGCTVTTKIDAQGGWNFSGEDFFMGFKSGQGTKTVDDQCNPQNSKEESLVGHQITFSRTDFLKDPGGQRHFRLLEFRGDKGMDFILVK